MNPRIYTYKVTFEEVPDFYWGVHKEQKFGEPYLGSPVTNKWKWEFYTPVLAILEIFPYTNEGWEKARELEDRLIRPDLNNPMCLNESLGGVPSLRILSEAGKIGGRVSADLGYLEYGSPNSIKTFESLSAAGKVGGAVTRDSGKLRETSRLGGLSQGPKNKGMKWYHRFDDNGNIIWKRSKTPLPYPWIPGRGERVKPNSIDKT